MILERQTLRTAATKLAKIRELRDALPGAWDTPRRWKIIREYYRLRRDDIDATWGRPFNPYELGLERFFTPIERALWADIRGMGLPFLLQYPVGRRFMDFADPHRQIAVEADGAAWHRSEDDAKKDEELHRAGWWVIRVRGRDCFGEAGTTAIQELRSMYFGIPVDEPEEEESY